MRRGRECEIERGGYEEWSKKVGWSCWNVWIGENCIRRGEVSL